MSGEARFASGCWVAMDADEVWHAFKLKPVRKNYEWADSPMGAKCHLTRAYFSFPDCDDWTKSLHQTRQVPTTPIRIIKRKKMGS